MTLRPVRGEDNGLVRIKSFADFLYRVVLIGASYELTKALMVDFLGENLRKRKLLGG